MARLGIISDTHGLLRPEAMLALESCDRIVHAGDIGNGRILDQLRAIAPTRAVRGNNDASDWASALPETARFDFKRLRIYAIHDLSHLDIDPSAAGVQVVVSGHSHRPCIEQRRGIFFINPGSAGPRRFNLPVSMAEIRVVGNEIRPRLIELSCTGVRRAVEA